MQLLTLCTEKQIAVIFTNARRCHARKAFWRYEQSLKSFNDIVWASSNRVWFQWRVRRYLRGEKERFLFLFLSFFFLIQKPIKTFPSSSQLLFSLIKIIQLTSKAERKRSRNQTWKSNNDCFDLIGVEDVAEIYDHVLRGKMRVCCLFHFYKISK